ncbi:unnamed protein product [Lasius platythorax]|uniref:Uncharacterized protein n=1 Tax=Lasius platythorax TaxID=488582 RepID=A0AAV2MZ36_9HYME
MLTRNCPTRFSSLRPFSWKAGFRNCRLVSWAPSEGAASATSAAEGGRLAEMARDASEILVGHHDEFEIARQSWEIGMDPVVDQILETQIQKANSIPFEPKVITVPESGWKTRVLTLFPNYVLTTGDLIRKQLWPLLEGEEWLDLDKVLSREKFNRMLGLTHRAGKLVSSDLSNTTDFIPHLYAQALWAGLLHHLEAPAWVRRYVSKMSHEDLGDEPVHTPRDPNGHPVEFHHTVPPA